MFDAYVDWMYEAMKLDSKLDFEAALRHAAASMGESRTRAAFEEAQSMFIN